MIRRGSITHDFPYSKLRASVNWFASITREADKKEKKEGDTKGEEKEDDEKEEEKEGDTKGEEKEDDKKEEEKEGDTKGEETESGKKGDEKEADKKGEEKDSAKEKEVEVPKEKKGLADGRLIEQDVEYIEEEEEEDVFTDDEEVDADGRKELEAKVEEHNAKMARTLHSEKAKIAQRKCDENKASKEEKEEEENERQQEDRKQNEKDSEKENEKELTKRKQMKEDEKEDEEVAKKKMKQEDTKLEHTKQANPKEKEPKKFVEVENTCMKRGWKQLIIDEMECVIKTTRNAAPAYARLPCPEMIQTILDCFLHTR